ncbi:MAG: hypothetical protein NTU44_01100 [Bacteroidetes bacterium]|nr:hypothetical protein [Bacteroidota bacterium]
MVTESLIMARGSYKNKSLSEKYELIESHGLVKKEPIRCYCYAIPGSIKHFRQQVKPSREFLAMENVKRRVMYDMDKIIGKSRLSNWETLTAFYMLTINNEQIAFPEDLKKIYDEILHSNFIQDLEDGWNDFEAPAFSKDVIFNAQAFLAKYAIAIHNIHGDVLPPPEINPVSNGSIDISWWTQKARMLINIKKIEGKILASYYGDLYNNENPKKGSINVTELDFSLITWMRNLVVHN